MKAILTEPGDYIPIAKLPAIQAATIDAEIAPAYVVTDDKKDVGLGTANVLANSICCCKDRE